MNLTTLFDLSLRGRRDEIALEFEGSISTFGDIDSRSNRLAQLLPRRGFRAGDRLCVYLAYCPESSDLYLACVKSGVIIVPIYVRFREPEIAHILRDAEPRAIVSRSAIAEHIPNWTPDELKEAARSMPDARPSIAPDGDAPVAIIYTSGTTGTSKGALLSHNNF